MKAQKLNQRQAHCNDLALKLRLHLGKGLREVKGFIRNGKA